MIPAEKQTKEQKQAVADYKNIRKVDLDGPPWSVPQPFYAVRLVKNEASFAGRKPNHACQFALPLKGQIGFRRPVFSPVDRGVQIRTIVVVTPGDKPAVQLIARCRASGRWAQLSSLSQTFDPGPTLAIDENGQRHFSQMAWITKRPTTSVIAGYATS